MAYTTIDDPSAYFHTQLYTGDGASSNSITNDANAGDFSPDWLWVKNRTTGGGAGPNIVFDTTRGNTKDLHTNSDEAEHTNTNVLLSFDTDGFSVGDSSVVNENTSNFVAWQWIANGGTTSSNTDGSITSTVQANTTAGFSVVTYTGTGSNATVGHGLGSAPRIIFIKDRDNGSTNWAVYNESAGNNGRLILNTTDAFGTSSTYWQDTSPTSSVFSLGTWVRVNQSSTNFIAYCFAEIQGYSKFGSYTGNSSTDGPFIYTGFKPAFVMIKRTDATGNWVMMDSTRDSFNVMDSYTRANLSDAELTSGRSIDFLSNGFKLRNANGNVNTNYNYIYMCFASLPFVSSEGAPTTAR